MVRPPGIPITSLSMGQIGTPRIDVPVAAVRARAKRAVPLLSVGVIALLLSACYPSAFNAPSTGNLPGDVSFSEMAALPDGTGASVQIAVPEGGLCQLSSSDPQLTLARTTFQCPTQLDWVAAAMPANTSGSNITRPVKLVVTEMRGMWGAITVLAGGDVAIYGANGLPVWDTMTWGSGVDRIVLADDGSLMAIGPRGVAWTSKLGKAVSGANLPSFTAPPPASAQLWVGGVMRAGSQLVSANGRYAAFMQVDGNFGIYDRWYNTPIFSTGTNAYVLGTNTLPVMETSGAYYSTGGATKVGIVGDSLTAAAIQPLASFTTLKYQVWIDGRSGYMINQQGPAVDYLLNHDPFGRPTDMVIELGTNNAFSTYLFGSAGTGIIPWPPVAPNADWRNQYQQLATTLSSTSCVIWVNLLTHGPIAGYNAVAAQMNSYLAAMVSAHPNFHLLDLDALVATHPDWYDTENFVNAAHLNGTGQTGLGANVYVSLLNNCGP